MTTKPKYPKYQKKDYCEACRIPYEPCQLDVDHIDGNHYNIKVLNLRTLCANCHRLKTFESQDWKKKGWFSAARIYWTGKR